MLKILKYFYLFIFLIFFNELMASERDYQLNKLLDKLKVSSQTSSFSIEQKIWDLWSTHPTNKKLTKKLAEGSKFVKENRLFKAVEIFTEVIEEDPNWAEAWNKRATVLYLLGDYNGSQDDINEVLNLEKRHFGALAGQGLVNIKLENYEKAISSYKKAQDIYPWMKSPEIMIKQIEQLIKQQLI